MLIYFNLRGDTTKHNWLALGRWIKIYVLVQIFTTKSFHFYFTSCGKEGGKKYAPPAGLEPATL
ncbi:hypothetical protein [Thermoflavifilum aggregans]|uniref:hypothetical protein n=1 Tax=Thermoflavifilum aggregans TaxID=454188 RepID=UPI000C2393CC|nr:hypothetical protein [Thermoflavifilum aggregans]